MYLPFFNKLWEAHKQKSKQHKSHIEVIKTKHIKNKNLVPSQAFTMQLPCLIPKLGRKAKVKVLFSMNRISSGYLKSGHPA